jgi:arylsulfatase
MKHKLIRPGLAVLTASAALLYTAVPVRAADKKPNILVIMGDDIGWFNPSAYSRGMLGYRTPNIDRIANEGALFTAWYGQQSCTAGRAAFVTGQSPIRTGLTKVGMPGADIGLSAEDPTVAEFLKHLGYATGQFGKNHLGDRNEFLPTVHGFDEFFGYLYHLDAMEDPAHPNYPQNLLNVVGPRNMVHSWATWLLLAELATDFWLCDERAYVSANATRALQRGQVHCSATDQGHRRRLVLFGCGAPIQDAG